MELSQLDHGAHIALLLIYWKCTPTACFSTYGMGHTAGKLGDSWGSMDSIHGDFWGSMGSIHGVGWGDCGSCSNSLPLHWS